MAVTTSRNAVPETRRCLKTAFSRSSRWTDCAPLTTGIGRAPAASDGPAARISWVSNMPRLLFATHWPHLFGRDSSHADRCRRQRYGGRRIGKEPGEPRDPRAGANERGDGLAGADHERVTDREELPAVRGELDDVRTALDAAEHELSRLVGDRRRLDFARVGTAKPQLRVRKRRIVGLPGRADDRRGQCQPA